MLLIGQVVIQQGGLLIIAKGDLSASKLILAPLTSHNFLDSALVSRTDWKVDPCKLLDASMADGNPMPVSGMC